MTRRLMTWMALVGLSVLGTAGIAWANSASPYPVDARQPNGERLTLFLRGTERLNWYEFVPEAANLTRESFREGRNRELARTPGFTVLRDEQGRYVYAMTNDQGEWAPSNRVVGRDEPPRPQRRLLPTPPAIARMAVSRLPATGLPQRAATPAGVVSNLVVLMRFADHASRPLPSRQDFETLFNADGGHPSLAPSGSVRDFYRENSYKKLTLQSTIVDWVTLPQNEAYYANGKSGLDAKVREAMVDALNLVAKNGMVNFEDFDNENSGVGDGWIDSITFVHSGYAAEFGGVAGGADMKDRIWSHRWVINTWSDPKSGVRVRDYNINPGIWSTSGSEIGRLGVICHELGHFFGLPDLYDYSGQGEGIGSWCLMANSWGFDGSQLHPPHMSAWCKIALGWNSATVIQDAKTYNVPATTLPDAKIYRVNFASGSPDEYLLIENRHPIGNFDGGIPAGTGGKGGLAIWHIDDAKSENDTPGFPGQPGFPGNGNHYWVGLLQADGKYDLEKGVNRGDADDVFRSGHIDAISPATTPSSNSYTSVEGPSIQKISASGNVMTFQFGAEPPVPEASKVVFAKFVATEIPTSHAVNFSPDGKAATLIFDRLLSFISGNDHAQTTTASLVLPIKQGDASSKAHLDLRGYVSTDEGGAASLVVQVGGVAQVVDLQAARQDSAKLKALNQAARKNLKTFQQATGTTSGFDWWKRIEVEIPKETDLTVTAVLITEKRVKSSQGAFLTIDTLDVELAP